MSRTKTVLPAVACLIALTAGCSGPSKPTGSGALGTQQPSTAPSGTPSVTPSTTSTPTPKPPATTHTPKPSNGDCLSYNPDNLTVEGTAASGTFLVKDGSTVVIRVHGQDDQVGQAALALAQRYRQHCFIGRNNTMDPKGDFIFDYWRSPSGQTLPIPGDDDRWCSEYNNANLTVEDMGEGQGW